MNPVSDVEALRAELIEVKAAQASRAPLEDLVKYLLYFWLSLSVVLGFVGWKQISDMDASISNEVSRQFPRDGEKYLEYQKLIEDTKTLYRDFEVLTKQYKERVDDLKLAEVAASDFDLEGQVEIILRESNVPSKVSNKEWRAKAITVLSKLKDFLASKPVPADFIFNAAQVCRQLNQFQLAEELTTAAYLKDPVPAIKALKLSSEVANKTGDDRARAFTDLMVMVEDLGYESSPHIVLAEAWNAAERSRNYGPLLDALDKHVVKYKKSGVPSYVFAIKAQALLRRSRPGDLELAKIALRQGYETYISESPQSQWNDSFVREYTELSRKTSEDREKELLSVSNGERESEIETLMNIIENGRLQKNSGSRHGD